MKKNILLLLILNLFVQSGSLSCMKRKWRNPDPDNSPTVPVAKKICIHEVPWGKVKRMVLEEQMVTNPAQVGIKLEELTERDKSVYLPGYLLNDSDDVSLQSDERGRLPSVQANYKKALQLKKDGNLLVALECAEAVFEALDWMLDIYQKHLNFYEMRKQNLEKALKTPNIISQAAIKDEHTKNWKEVNHAQEYLPYIKLLSKSITKIKIELVEEIGKRDLSGKIDLLAIAIKHAITKAIYWGLYYCKDTLNDFGNRYLFLPPKFAPNGELNDAPNIAQNVWNSAFNRYKDMLFLQDNLFEIKNITFKKQN